MSDTTLPRRAPRTWSSRRHTLRPPHPSPSSSLRRLSSPPPSRRLPTENRSKPVRIFKRYSSDPNIWASTSSSVNDDYQQQPKILLASESERILCTPLTDVFGSSFSLPGFSPHSPPLRSEGYNKEAKVVINVSVEASPGPIRAMVKLGCSVEEMIKLVVKKYREEGRTPKLDKNGAFELHPSYFSLQSLDKCERIGDVGSRSFYLRRSGNNGGSNSIISETCIGVRAADSFALPVNPPPLFLFPSYIGRKVSKLVRASRRIWKVLICDK